MTQFWPSRQSLPAIHMADDELRLAQQQQAQRGLFDGMTLQNLQNIPHNIYGLFSNAVADTANTGRAFLDPSVAPDPTRPTAAGDRRLAQRGLDGIGGAALAAYPAAMMMRGGRQALGALASNQKPAATTGLFTDYSGSQRIVKTADGGGVAGSITPDGKTLEIGSSWLPEASRGQGTGKASYQKLIDDARRDGLKVQSDRQVSGSAANVYRSLGAQQNPRAQVSEGGTVTAPRGEPAFLFSDTRQAAPAGGMAALERWDDFTRSSPREPVSISTRDGQPLTVVREPGMPGKMTYRVFDGGKKVGEFYVSPNLQDLGSMSVTNASVSPNHQRKGIGSAAYDLIQRDVESIGGRLIPQGKMNMTDAALGFWKARGQEPLFSNPLPGIFVTEDNQ